MPSYRWARDSLKEDGEQESTRFSFLMHETFLVAKTIPPHSPHHLNGFYGYLLRKPPFDLRGLGKALFKHRQCGRR